MNPFVLREWYCREWFEAEPPADSGVSHTEHRCAVPKEIPHETSA